MTLAMILAASGLSGLVALGAAFLLLRGRLWSHERSHLFLSFAAGTLIAVSFLDLLPEAAEHFGETGATFKTALTFAFGGFLLFFIIEKLIFWYHCHEEDCDVHTSTAMVLLGDTIHNALDGVGIAASFMISPAVGLATTAAIFFHEIPQEVADFSVLLSGGMKPRRALFFNVLSSFASLLGAVLAYFFIDSFEGALPMLLAATAGGFLYISASDLIPEIHHERRRNHILAQLAIFLLGIALVAAAIGFTPEH